jgi:hypothetical protein
MFMRLVIANRAKGNVIRQDYLSKSLFWNEMIVLNNSMKYK